MATSQNPIEAPLTNSTSELNFIDEQFFGNLEDDNAFIKNNYKTSKEKFPTGANFEQQINPLNER